MLNISYNGILSVPNIQGGKNNINVFKILDMKTLRNLKEILYFLVPFPSEVYFSTIDIEETPRSAFSTSASFKEFKEGGKNCFE
jgi:hypothetical protein